MTTPTFDWRTLYFRTLVVIAAFATAAAVYFLRHILFLAFLALLVAIFLSYLSRPLERRLHLPRWLAILVTVAGLAVFFGLLSYLLISPLTSQIVSLAEQLPSIIEGARLHFTVWLGDLVRWAPQIQPEKLVGEAAKYAGDAAARLLKILSGGIGLVADMVTVLVLGIFLAIERRQALQTFYRLFRNRTPEEMSQLASRGIRLLQGWMLGQLASMLILGVFSTIAYWITGIDYFLVFGALAALFNVIPYLGSILAALGPLLWAIFAEPSKIVWVLVIWAATQVLEGNLITPLIMRRYVQLSPLAVIAGILVLGSLFGFLGVMAAVPLTAMIFLLLGEAFPWWRGNPVPSSPAAQEE